MPHWAKSNLSPLRMEIEGQGLLRVGMEIEGQGLLWVDSGLSRTLRAHKLWQTLCCK